VAAALQARWFKPPDVWIQLLQHFLQDAACRQALLDGTGSAAAQHEAIREQLQAMLAEELAASSLDR
jgi:hypothetical protein